MATESFAQSNPYRGNHFFYFQEILIFRSGYLYKYFRPKFTCQILYFLFSFYKCLVLIICLPFFHYLCIFSQSFKLKQNAETWNLDNLIFSVISKLFKWFWQKWTKNYFLIWCRWWVGSWNYSCSIFITLY